MVANVEQGITLVLETVELTKIKMFGFLTVVVLAAVFCNGIAAPEGNSICTLRNSYYPVSGSCDSYIECKEYEAHEMLCPDGLHYNPGAVWPAYPCSYSMDISCEGRGSPQPAIPTPECPHQYGFYSAPDAANDCGRYRMCVEGRAIDMTCPSGLAFNPVNARCDWPDFVPSCNVEAYIGFKCPAVPLMDNGEPSDVIVNYKFEGNCYAFYSCEKGHARLLTCDIGYAFDPSTGHCENADKVKCV